MKKAVLLLSMVFIVSTNAMAAKMDSNIFIKAAGVSPDEFQIKYGISAQKLYDATILLNITFEKSLGSDLNKFNEKENLWFFAFCIGLYHGNETKIVLEEERISLIKQGYNEQYIDNVINAIKTAFSSYKNILGLSVEETEQRIGQELFVADFSSKIITEVK